MLFKSSKEEQSAVEVCGYLNNLNTYSLLEELSFQRNRLRFKQKGGGLMVTKVWLGYEPKRHSKRAE